MEIIVLEHDRDAPAGLLADWASTRGHRLRILEVPALVRWPEPADADAFVSLGSESSVHASPPRWLAHELALLRDAHGQQVPVLGICFGAQALATALGGQVARASSPTVEWSLLDARDEALIPQGPWLRWHEDVFTLPPGAREIASAGGTPLAFAAGASVAVQFHPEADAAIARAWVASSREQFSARASGRHGLPRQLELDGLSRQLELDGLPRQLELDASGARRRAHELFDRVAAHWMQR